MEEEKFQWDFEELKLKAIQERKRMEIEKMNLDPNRFIEADISLGELIEHMKDYKPPRERLWIKINSRNFKRAIEIIAKQIGYFKDTRHQTVHFMRCCLVFWFGRVTKAQAHVIDTSFKKTINSSHVMYHARSRHQQELYGVELNEAEKLKKKLQDDYLRSEYDPTFVFNPDLGDIAKAFEPYFK